MPEQPINVLILCTGNSARSILGEVLVNAEGKGKLQGFSAGSQPAGAVNPGALRQLKQRGHSTDGLRSKSWDEFSGDDAQQFDIVVTVCDNAAGETCPLWSGSPVTVHWGIPDPAAVDGSQDEIDAAFAAAYDTLKIRISEMAVLPLADLGTDEIRAALDSIARANPAVIAS